MRGTLQLGRFGGVPVGLHYSWLFFFALITWSLATSFPLTFPGVDGPTAWIAAAVAAILFLFSVLGHELAHAWMARARHVPVRGITLFILGGAAEIERDADRPLDELLITAVGPLSSLLFGIGFAVLAAFSGPWPAVRAVTATMALINISLAVFNLIPGFPLDGGRILRSILWGVMHDFVRASRIAARLGQLVGWGMIVFGVAEMVLWDQGIGGLWMAGIGWYLSSMAKASFDQVLLQQALGRIPVRQIMRTNFAWVYAGTRVRDAVQQYFDRTPRPGLPVLRDGRLVGLLTLPQVRNLDPGHWDITPVDAIMIPAGRLPTIAPGADAAALLSLMQRNETPEVPVVDGDRLVGLVTQDDLLQAVRGRPRPAPADSPIATGLTPRR